MVECNLDLIFGSLAHPVRRDILRQSAKRELRVTTIAKRYNMSLAAVSKHLHVLENAQLITKHRQGKEQIVRLSRSAFVDAADYLRTYERLWNERFDSLERYLSSLPPTA